MKDHELRELINDVTAVARIYAHTQQLREQIAHLIIPAINAISPEQARLQNINIENLNRQLDFEAKKRTELRKKFAIAIAQINGPSFSDGHDCEGFVGGCERMGCPGGTECTELPANKK